MKKEKKKKNYALHATNLFLVHRCYSELLRLYYHKPEAFTNYSTVAQRIKTFLERLYNETITDYLKTCETGQAINAKAQVRKILKAIGPCAFDEPWFTEGLKSLYLRGITFQFPIFGREKDYQALYLHACKVEKRHKKPFEIYTKQKEKKQSDYYREFPQKADICHLHSCYGLLHEPLHSHILEDIPPMDTAEFDALLRAVDKFLPK